MRLRRKSWSDADADIDGHGSSEADDSRSVDSPSVNSRTVDSRTVDSRSNDSRRVVRSERIGVLEAMRWHWITALLPVLVLVGGAVALGLLREPVHTASSRLSVQVAAGGPAALAGSVTAAGKLASSYSRAIEAEPVVDDVARRASLSPQKVRDRISATQVPDTPVITVSATGGRERQAVALANLAAQGLQDYVSGLREPLLGGDRLLGKFGDAVSRYEAALENQQQLKAVVESTGSKRKAAEANAALELARVDTQTALLERDVLRQNYLTGRGLYTAPVDVIARASSATSDFAARLQLLILIGFAAGIAVGALLATMRANKT